MLLKKFIFKTTLKTNIFNFQNTLKKNLFTNPDKQINDNIKELSSLNNIHSFNAKQMKIVQNKIILNQSHLGLKTTRNDTYLIYQTEESIYFILLKKFSCLLIFIFLLEVIRRYKKEGYSKYILYSAIGCLGLYCFLLPRFSYSKSIRKIELNKNLNNLIITLYNNKILEIKNNDIYLNTNFRHMENFDNKRFLLGINGKNYYASLRFPYIPNYDLFNCVIRGFEFSHTSK